ncbi:hypothetical protein V9T40_013239 [Parthenolecanium corni]|uniref:Uncharacterized protein n=1 Tax=Parthenolecanium corni TaxID=536013 RepID=A0AAN9TIS6_9HEMI
MIGLAGLVSQVSDTNAFKYSGEYPPSSQAKQKLPVILMHKQALSENGAFNYAFAGDNGIKQGETIHPDGTRAGAYSYVDPEGETVSVKYTAGKDGFKIVQGDHVPRAASGLYGAASAASPAKYSPSYGRSGSEELDDDFRFGASSGAVGSYSHQHRAKINPAVYRVHEESSAEQFPSHFVPVTYGKSAQPRSHDLSDEDDAAAGPHSFGSGYSFEFGDTAN